MMYCIVKSLQRRVVRLLHCGFSRTIGAAVAFAPMALTGCVSQAPQGIPALTLLSAPPAQSLADYLGTDCEAIWALKGEQVDNNPLFWLRGMDCATRLAPERARALARGWGEMRWQSAFRQGILLSKARITPHERRYYVDRLDTLSAEIPVRVRPLYQMWRDEQALELGLVEARGRCNQLQQHSDRELDALRLQHQKLSAELARTRHQLQNLMDIERQLSSRKSSDNFSSEQIGRAHV